MTWTKLLRDDDMDDDIRLNSRLVREPRRSCFSSAAASKDVSRLLLRLEECGERTSLMRRLMERQLISDEVRGSAGTEDSREIGGVSTAGGVKPNWTELLFVGDGDMVAGWWSMVMGLW